MKVAAGVAAGIALEKVTAFARNRRRMAATEKLVW